LLEQLKWQNSTAKKSGLLVTGVMPLSNQDGFDRRFKSIALLSPDPTSFWFQFSMSKQAVDGLPDPIDRWSKNTILQIADDVDGLAVFPFEGPPYHPFSTWAQRAVVPALVAGMTGDVPKPNLPSNLRASAFHSVPYPLSI
jgi:hypothetical protein